MNGCYISTKESGSWSEVGCTFEPEDIHVMRFGESEQDFMHVWKVTKRSKEDNLK